jgi:predicted O-methyltransferase YrrM
MTDKPRALPPVKIEALPCLTQAATLLLGALAQGADVWEFGSGGSTVWFAERVKSLTSIEDNEDWARAVAGALLDRVGALAHVHLRYVPTAKQPDAITGAGLFDLVFVDCLRQEQRRRSIVLGSAHVRPGGWLVADDYTFPKTNAAVEALRKAGWDVAVVAGVKVHPIKHVPVNTATAFCRRANVRNCS